MLKIENIVKGRLWRFSNSYNIEMAVRIFLDILLELKREVTEGIKVEELKRNLRESHLEKLAKGYFEKKEDGKWYLSELSLSRLEKYFVVE